MQFVNLTPHTLNNVGQDGTITTIPSQGPDSVARVSSTTQVVAVHNGIEMTTVSFGEV